MINTDDYEGHTPAPWNVYGPHPLYRHGTFDNEGVAQPLPFTQIDTLLIASAPLLLAEVKRLKRLLTQAYDELSLATRWVEKYFESKGKSCADIAQAVENFENYRERGEEE